MKPSQLYKSNIIEHYQSPKNSVSILNSTHHAKVTNVTCGDEIELWLDIDNGIVRAVGHETRGCAICVASMSILSEQIKGLPTAELELIPEEKILANLGMEQGSGRMQCALLSLKAVKEAIQK